MSVTDAEYRRKKVFKWPWHLFYMFSGGWHWSQQISRLNNNKNMTNSLWKTMHFTLHKISIHLLWFKLHRKLCICSKKNVTIILRRLRYCMVSKTTQSTKRYCEKPHIIIIQRALETISLHFYHIQQQLHTLNASIVQKSLETIKPGKKKLD